MNWSVFPKPFRILWQAPVASNSSHSAQLLSLVLSFLLRIFHSPTRKSKSLLEEVFDGITSKSPVGVNDSCDITSSYFSATSRSWLMIVSEMSSGEWD